MFIAEASCDLRKSLVEIYHKWSSKPNEHDLIGITIQQQQQKRNFSNTMLMLSLTYPPSP